MSEATYEQARSNVEQYMKDSDLPLILHSSKDRSEYAGGRFKFVLVTPWTDDLWVLYMPGFPLEEIKDANAPILRLNNMDNLTWQQALLTKANTKSVIVTSLMKELDRAIDEVKRIAEIMREFNVEVDIHESYGETI